MKRLKGLVRRTLEKHLPTTLDAMRIIAGRRFEFLPPRITFASGPLHARIKARFAGRPGTFFEVGANNGVEASNTAYLERYCGWRGILVEATPHKFVECVRNRRRADVIHAALTPKAFDAAFIEITYSNLMSITALSEISIDTHVAAGAGFLGTESRLSGTKFLAPARTVDAILAERGYPEIDFFSLDVEGAELQVLKGIDFSRSRPRHFLIEARDPAVIGAFMTQHGYRMAEQLSHHDYLFVDERAQPK